MQLAGGDVLKMDAVREINLYDAFAFLAGEAALNEAQRLAQRDADAKAKAKGKGKAGRKR